MCELKARETVLELFFDSTKYFLWYTCLCFLSYICQRSNIFSSYLKTSHLLYLRYRSWTCDQLFLVPLVLNHGHLLLVLFLSTCETTMVLQDNWCCDLMVNNVCVLISYRIPVFTQYSKYWKILDTHNFIETIELFFCIKF